MDKFDSIFFGGTGWNLLWSFGVSKKLHELGFRKYVNRVGSISAGCMSALAFLDAADYEVGIVQSEQLRHQSTFFSTEFRKKYRYYFEGFANKDPLKDIKNSGCEYYVCYLQLNDFPSVDLKFRKDFNDRDDLLTTCLAGCYIPFLFGIEPNALGLPILQNGDFAVDAGCIGRSTYRWDEKTLLIAPNEKTDQNTIGGNLSVLNTIGIRKKALSDKQLFLKGYMDASKWYAEYYLHEKSWRNQEHWYKKLEDYDLFKKRF